MDSFSIFVESLVERISNFYCMQSFITFYFDKSDACGAAVHSSDLESGGLGSIPCRVPQLEHYDKALRTRLGLLCF